MMNKKQIKSLKRLVYIGLHYKVDYIYLLEDMERILDGEILEPEEIDILDY